MKEKEVKLEDLIGKRVVALFGADADGIEVYSPNNEIIFICDDGTYYQMYCEDSNGRVPIDNIEGQYENIIGCIVKEAKSASRDMINPVENDGLKRQIVCTIRPTAHFPTIFSWVSAIPRDSNDEMRLVIKELNPDKCHFTIKDIGQDDSYFDERHILIGRKVASLLRPIYFRDYYECTIYLDRSRYFFHQINFDFHH